MLIIPHLHALREQIRVCPRLLLIDRHHIHIWLLYSDMMHKLLLLRLLILRDVLLLLVAVPIITTMVGRRSRMGVHIPN